MTDSSKGGIVCALLSENDPQADKGEHHQNTLGENLGYHQMIPNQGEKPEQHKRRGEQGQNTDQHIAPALHRGAVARVLQRIPEGQMAMREEPDYRADGTADQLCWSRIDFK